jgi:hypothetical protein
MTFADTTPETLFTELKELEAKIEQAGQNVHFAGANAAQKRAAYEELKNKMLIQMMAEEAGDKNLKRTVDQRTAIYRSTYSAERLEWQLAENEWKAATDYLKALLGNQSSLQTRNRIVEADRKMAAYA